MHPPQGLSSVLIDFYVVYVLCFGDLNIVGIKTWLEKYHRNFSSNKNYVFMFYVLIDDDDDDVDVSRTSPISRTCLFRIMYPII